MNRDACEGLRRKAIAGVSNGTEAINAFICIASLAQSVQSDACCLPTLSELLDKQRGLAGLNVTRTSEADRKADEVAVYIGCLLRQLEK